MAVAAFGFDPATPAMAASQPWDLLEAALQGERRALLDHDVDALMRSTAAKLEALAAVDGAPLPEGVRERVQQLSELNRANGELLARRRREVGWALRQLGRVDQAPSYNARGSAGNQLHSRILGVG